MKNQIKYFKKATAKHSSLIVNCIKQSNDDETLYTFYNHNDVCIFCGTLIKNNNRGITFVTHSITGTREELHFSNRDFDIEY